MPLWRITSFKRLVSDTTIIWSNVYTINVPSQLSAVTEGMAIVSSEQAVHTADVQFFKMGVRALTGGSQRTQVTSTDIGLLGNDPSIRLPLWNVARVDFLDASGRPEIKYLRMPLQEDMVTGSFLDTPTIDTLTDNYATGLAGDPAYVGPSGEAHVGFVVHSNVQMRQTSWHRRTRPGFHRGWVAN